MNKLTNRQEKFAQAYIESGNATQAAIKAGYSPKTAYSQGQRLLKNVEVWRRVEESMDKLKEQTGMTVQSIVLDLRLQREMAQAAGNHAAAIRATELIGKTIGAFTDRVTREETHEDRLLERIRKSETAKCH